MRASSPARHRALFWFRGLAATLPWVVVTLGTAMSGRVHAQEPPPRIGPFVVDIRGTSPNFPQDALLAQSRGLSIDELPARGFGLDGGAHLYLFKWRVITVGIGAQATLARATLSSVEQDGIVTARAVTSWFTSLTPQLSFNFGTGDGWSYISGGLGRAVWSTVPDGQSALPGDEERLTTVNYGGGARWFAKPHLAFTFDVRFHQIDPGTPLPGLPGSPRTTMMIIGAGVSLK